MDGQSTTFQHDRADMPSLTSDVGLGASLESKQLTPLPSSVYRGFCAWLSWPTLAGFGPIHAFCSFIATSIWMKVYPPDAHRVGADDMPASYYVQPDALGLDSECHLGW